MRSLTRLVVASALAVAAVAAVSVDVASAGPPEIKAAFGKSPDGPFHRQLRARIDRDDAKTFYLRVKSLSGDSEPVSIERTANPYYLTDRWFKTNGEEITDDVHSGSQGYGFNVKANQPKVFRLRAYHQPGGPLADQCLEIRADGDGPDSFARLAFHDVPGECFPL